MSRPDKSPSWVDGDEASKVVEPGTTKKAAGFLYKERMPFQYLNWLFRHFVKWVLHIDESVNQFDPHASLINDEFINVTAGRINSGTTVIEQSVQQIDYTSFIPTTASTSRIDRIVIDNITGVIERIAGTEAGSPTVPSITISKSPICQVLIDENTTVIESSMITDERVSGSLEKTDAQLANHIRAGNTQIPSGGTSYSLLDIDATVTTATWTTVGPTGSGATVIWSSLDHIPSSTRILKLDIHTSFETLNVAGNNLGGIGAMFEDGDSSYTGSTSTNVSAMVDSYGDSVDKSIFISEYNAILVPVNSSNVFKVRWQSEPSNATENIRAFYRGFIID